MERKTFVKPMRLDGFKYENEASFLSLTATVTTSDCGDCTDLYVRNREVENIEMSENRFVNIVLYRAQMFGKLVRETSFSFTDIQPQTFSA